MLFKPTPRASAPVPDGEATLRALFAPPRLTGELDEEQARARGWHESSWSLREGLDVHEIEELDTVPMVLDSAFADRREDS
jgi:hypothetical protein